MDPKYPLEDAMKAKLENYFTYHRPFGDQSERYERIRSAGLDFAARMVEATPPSAEQTLAIRALQEAVMWANASIALNEKES